MFDLDDDTSDFNKCCKWHNSDNCIDCNANVFEIGEYYMLTDELWASIVKGDESHGMLCIFCVENRLGRFLNRDDFNHSPLNQTNFSNKSETLINRMVNPVPDCKCNICTY